TSMEDTVVIVTGLPRSGTSMLMGMLEAGGLSILSDGVRNADEDNPRGYYELERVKRLHRRADWLLNAQGKVVKIVAPLLPLLPIKKDIIYHVIVLERDLGEVIASQRKMLERRKKEGGRFSEEQLRRILARQMAQARSFLQKNGIPHLRLNYARSVAAPLAASREIAEFLGGIPSAEAMARAVDGGLYRNRRGGA
ncbi:MAG: hypothetical protein HQL31_10350, partial [Planctomycetes bacterium]|nr:hypothetical protein [Planctomycetota bacterium]